jgi:hypothetical protein
MLKWKTTQYRKGNKYNARKSKGFTSDKLYDSQAERNRAEYLKAQETAGEIANLMEHPKVQLTKFHAYKPDFCYEENGRLVFEDVKGAVTDRFRINCKLWRERGPGVLRISKRMYKSSKWNVKEIHPDTYDEAMWTP